MALETLSRREIEGDTANPGIAGPSGSSGRIAGSAPEHREREVLSDGWPFRVSDRSVIVLAGTQIQARPIVVEPVTEILSIRRWPIEVSARF